MRGTIHNLNLHFEPTRGRPKWRNGGGEMELTEESERHTAPSVPQERLGQARTGPAARGPEAHG